MKTKLDTNKKVSTKPKSKALKQGAVRRSVSISISLDIAETLVAYISGGLGTSCDDEFSRQMKIVQDKLDKAMSKHYA